jgi:hypothetical protein
MCELPRHRPAPVHPGQCLWLGRCLELRPDVHLSGQPDPPFFLGGSASAPFHLHFLLCFGARHRRIVGSGDRPPHHLSIPKNPSNHVRAITPLLTTRTLSSENRWVIGKSTFPRLVNRATTHIHRRFAVAEPVVHSLVPKEALRCHKPTWPLPTHSRWSVPSLPAPLSTVSAGSPWTAAVGPPPPHILWLQAEVGPGEAHRPHRWAPRRFAIVTIIGRRSEPNPPPPHRRTTTTVSPRCREAAQRAPRTPLTVEPPSLLHLATPFTANRRAAAVALDTVTAASLRTSTLPAGLGQTVWPIVALWPAAHRGPPVRRGNSLGPESARWPR